MCPASLCPPLEPGGRSRRMEVGRWRWVEVGLGGWRWVEVGGGGYHQTQLVCFVHWPTYIVIKISSGCGRLGCDTNMPSE